MPRPRRPRQVDTLTCSVESTGGQRTKTLKVPLNSPLTQQATPKRSYKEVFTRDNDDSDDESDESGDEYDYDNDDSEDEYDDDSDDDNDEPEMIKVSTYIKRLVLIVYVGRRRVPNICRMNIDSKVEEVKKRITNKTGYDYSYHRLILDDTTMEDHRRLFSYGILQSAELLLRK